MFMSPARNHFAAEFENSESNRSTWARCFTSRCEAVKILIQVGE
jgi:hypothetical protein